MSTDQTLEERLVQIAQAALEQTRGGQMSWRATDDEEAFLFSGSQTSLIVNHYSAQQRFELSVLNARGTIIAEVMTVAHGMGTAAEMNTYGVFSSLHDAAKRSALDIDTLLDSVLKDVETASEPPF